MRLVVLESSHVRRISTVIFEECVLSTLAATGEKDKILPRLRLALFAITYPVGLPNKCLTMEMTKKMPGTQG
jgi:hypothetical protein